MKCTIYLNKESINHQIFINIMNDLYKLTNYKLPDEILNIVITHDKIKFNIFDTNRTIGVSVIFNSTFFSKYLITYEEKEILEKEEVIKEILEGIDFLNLSVSKEEINEILEKSIKREIWVSLHINDFINLLSLDKDIEIFVDSEGKPKSGEILKINNKEIKIIKYKDEKMLVNISNFVIRNGISIKINAYYLCMVSTFLSKYSDEMEILIDPSLNTVVFGVSEKEKPRRNISINMRVNEITGVPISSLFGTEIVSRATGFFFYSDYLIMTIREDFPMKVVFEKSKSDYKIIVLISPLVESEEEEKKYKS